MIHSMSEVENLSAKFKMSYWGDQANTTIRRPLWPRECDITGKTLWLKPAVRGETFYYMRSGSEIGRAHV